jgi:hypothetical protein
MPCLSTQRAPIALSLLFGALFLSAGCEKEANPRFAAPALTFKTHQEALAAKDLELLWACYSSSYKESSYGNDYATWAREWQQKEDAWIKAELRREIVDERIINDRISYLLFDSSTLNSPQTSPFSYFVREPEGWKMTTHLDSVFHQELEQAIARGEFKLPND